MQSRAATVDAYLKELPAERRAAIETVRKVILANLDRDCAEGMQYGMIGYFVPHSRYPAGYHCNPKQPLPYAGLASQKNYMSLYLGALYVGCEDGRTESPDARWFREAWTKSGRKLDMGVCCVRFKKLEDVPLDVVGEAIRRVPVKTYIERYEQVLTGRGWRRSKPAATSAGSSKVAPAKRAAPAGGRRTRKPAKKKPVAKR